MTTLGSVPDRLARNRYAVDDEVSHIDVDQDVVRATRAADLLRRVCPAHVYSPGPDGTVAVQHAACLECGACLAVAPAGAVRWHYPRGGFGVVYREG
jgi:ferredoxin like protein